MSGFISSGYGVICDNSSCCRGHNFPHSRNVAELKEDMKARGLFSKDGKHFCSEDCQRESIDHTCLEEALVSENIDSDSEDRADLARIADAFESIATVFLLFSSVFIGILFVCVLIFGLWVTGVV